MLKGDLTIVRDNHNEIYLEIHDKSSGCRFVNLRIDLRNFAMALTGVACRPCWFNFRPENVGKRRELKRVLVPRPSFNASKEDLIKLMEPFLTDGWTASVDDATNDHNWRTNDKAEVTMTRFVSEEANDD